MAGYPLPSAVNDSSCALSAKVAAVISTIAQCPLRVNELPNA